MTQDELYGKMWESVYCNVRIERANGDVLEGYVKRVFSWGDEEYPEPYRGKGLLVLNTDDDRTIELYEDEIRNIQILDEKDLKWIGSVSKRILRRKKHG